MSEKIIVSDTGLETTTLGTLVPVLANELARQLVASPYQSR